MFVEAGAITVVVVVAAATFNSVNELLKFSRFSFIALFSSFYIPHRAMTMSLYESIVGSVLYDSITICIAHTIILHFKSISLA